MTINLTDVTFDLLVAEQLHDIVPCAIDECESTAHWYLRCCGCGNLILRCASHRAVVDRRHIGALYTDCVECDHVYAVSPTPLPWVAL